MPQGNARPMAPSCDFSARGKVPRDISRENAGRGWQFARLRGGHCLQARSRPYVHQNLSRFCCRCADAGRSIISAGFRQLCPVHRKPAGCWLSDGTQAARWKLREACSVEARDECPQLPDPPSGDIYLLSTLKAGPRSSLSAPFGAGLTFVVKLSALPSLLRQTCPFASAPHPSPWRVPSPAYSLSERP